jgi:3'-phosphoadenosine 5'-phosphosulfate sulfotransferase (PAPS reductase)/FAD synthetase
MTETMRSLPNPFRLPDGPVAIQFSGGRTSGMMLHHILDAHDGQLPPNAHVLFQNTGREMPETLDFVAECGERWGVRIVWLEHLDEAPGYAEVSHNSAARDGEPFMALMRRRKFTPNRVTRFCTTELKVRASQKWLNAAGYSTWTAVIGIRADEAHRAKQRDKDPWTLAWPMVPAGITRRDVSAFWRLQPFTLNLPDKPAGKTPLGNCDGCFLKSERSRAYLARYHPERAAWWAAVEAEIGHFAPPLERSTWAQLIEHARQQPDWVFDADDGASVYCETGFGGCHD